VVLTGEGGDELFAGYPTYLGHRLAGVANRIPLPVAAVLRSLTHRLTPRDTHVSIPHLVERLLSVRDLTPLERHVEWFGTLGRTEVPALLSEDLRTALDPGDTRANFASVGRALDDIGGAKGSNPSLVVYQLLDFELYLSGGLLVKVDRATMAHGLESRAPFLHHPLVEYAMALPSGAKLRGTTGKWVLKRAGRGSYRSQSSIGGSRASRPRSPAGCVDPCAASCSRSSSLAAWVVPACWTRRESCGS